MGSSQRGSMRALAGRRLAIPWRRAGRAAMGPDGSWPARFVVGARMVPPAGRGRFKLRMDFSRTPRRTEHGDVRRTTASASWLRTPRRQSRLDGGNVRLRPQQRARRRLQRAASPKRRTTPAPTRSTRGSNRCRSKPMCCGSAYTPLSAAEARGASARTRKRRGPRRGDALTLGGLRTIARPWAWDFGDRRRRHVRISCPNHCGRITVSSPVSFHVFFACPPAGADGTDDGHDDDRT